MCRKTAAYKKKNDTRRGLNTNRPHTQTHDKNNTTNDHTKEPPPSLNPVLNRRTPEKGDGMMGAKAMWG